MKNMYYVLFICLLSSMALGSDLISIEDFKKLDPTQRAYAIQKAPSEQKEVLKKIDLHLLLLQKRGGEEGLRRYKESALAGLRGLGSLESLFDVCDNLHDIYIGGVYQANEKSGMSLKKQEAIIKQLQAELEIKRKRLKEVHSIVLYMSASPEAIKLNQKADEWLYELVSKYWTNNKPYRYITKKELVAVETRLAGIFEEMKKCPVLPPAEVQKAYDALPDEQMMR